MALVNVETLKRVFLNRANLEKQKGNMSVAKGCLWCYDFVSKRLEPVDTLTHACWVKDEENVKCSACKHEAFVDDDFTYVLFDFCPYCGAKMDGEN